MLCLKTTEMCRLISSNFDHSCLNTNPQKGANWNVGSSSGLFEYQPVITSYDYDSPLTEYGQLTVKANITRKLISEKVGYPIPEVEYKNPSPGNFFNFLNYFLTLLTVQFSSTALKIL